MLKDKLLRKFLLLSLLMGVVLPLYEFAFIQPSYRQLLVEETEDDARRFTRDLVRTFNLDRQELAPGHLPPQIDLEVRRLQSDVLLLKLRVFGPSGTILYSTVKSEVGTVNNQPYFRNIVASGQLFSKVVVKNGYSAEHQKLNADVVETYVPIMAAGKFLGAVETYYDITAHRAKLAALARHSNWLLALLSTGFLSLVIVLLHKAGELSTARVAAEEALRQANERLEGRVAKRTGELLEANRQLHDEIAERSLAQVALAEALDETRAAKEKLDAVLTSVEDGLLVLDGKGTIRLFNPAATALLGLSASAYGRSLCEVLQLPLLRDRICALVQSGATPGQFDFELPTAGRPRPQVFQGRISPLRPGPQADGEDGGMVLLVQDVSREREVERMKSEFLAMAAHELHTPLTTIVGYSELLASIPPETFSLAQQQEFIGLLHLKALALARLVDDLLDISRIEAGQSIPLQLALFSLTDLLERVVGEYRQQGTPHRFELEVVAEDLELLGDAGRIEQVIENLLSNAVKYSPEGGTVRVVAGSDGRHCSVRVSDQGIGMTAEQAVRVFERFYRADSSDTAARGTGLGMSIAKHIVEAHGGELRIESQPGKGTTVIVTLPLAPPE